jgi:hypothetical protein
MNSNNNTKNDVVSNMTNINMNNTFFVLFSFSNVSHHKMCYYQSNRHKSTILHEVTTY